jgi:hypothetical protein
MKQITQGVGVVRTNGRWEYVTPFGRVKCVDMLHGIQMLCS